MSLPPIWIEEFVQQLSYCLFPQGSPTPLGCHFHQEADCWEIAIFPSLRKSNLNSSASDTPLPAPFTFDIQQALTLFDDLQHIDWVSLPISHENEVGPHLLLEGIVNDQPVLTRICAVVPERFQHEPELIIQES